MGDTIAESLAEAWEDTKEFFVMFFIIGGFVYIPAGFFFGMLWVHSMVSETVFVLLQLPMLALMMITLSFWINYFGADDPAPPLVP